jgi:hypothetical protein
MYSAKLVCDQIKYLMSLMTESLNTRPEEAYQTLRTYLEKKRIELDAKQIASLAEDIAISTLELNRQDNLDDDQSKSSTIASVQHPEHCSNRSAARFSRMKFHKLCSGWYYLLSLYMELLQLYDMVHLQNMLTLLSDVIESVPDRHYLLLGIFGRVVHANLMSNFDLYRRSTCASWYMSMQRQHNWPTLN